MPFLPACENKCQRALARGYHLSNGCLVHIKGAKFAPFLTFCRRWSFEVGFFLMRLSSFHDFKPNSLTTWCFFRSFYSASKTSVMSPALSSAHTELYCPFYFFLVSLQRTAKFPTGSVVPSAGIVVGIATVIP